MNRRRPSGGALLVAGALAIAFVPMAAALSDPDLWWHLRMGHLILDTRTVPHAELFSYTAVGNVATFHEWGSEVLFALLDRVGGLTAVTLVPCVLAWTGLIALAIRCRDRGVPAWVIAAAVLLAAKSLQPVTGPRPQMLGFALLCWTLLLCERHLARGGRLIWALPLVFCVWANLHGGFLYGVGIVGLLLAVEAVRTAAGIAGAATADRLRTLLFAALLGALAACVNPVGPGLYRYVIESGRTEARRPIIEWMSPDFHDPGLWPLLVLIAGLVVLGSVTRGPGLRDGVLAACGVAASLIAVRNVEVAVALGIPALAVMLGAAVDALPQRLRPRLRSLRPVSVAVLGAAAVGVAGVGVARVADDASTSGVAAALPACAATVMAAQPGDIRVYAPYPDSGYLIERDWPHLRVYNYGESVSLGDGVLSDAIRIASGTGATPSALALLDASRTTAVLAAVGSPLDGAVAGSGGWHIAAVDHGRDLWLRGAGVADRSC